MAWVVVPNLALLPPQSNTGDYVLTRRQTAWRLFGTAWIVYALHFATDIVREHYPALALGDHFFAKRVNPLPLFVLTGAVLYGIWSPRFRRER